MLPMPSLPAMRNSLSIFTLILILAGCGDDTTYYSGPPPGDENRDTVSPLIANVGSTSNTTVVVSFTEAMGDEAENPANYQITRLSLCANPNGDGVRLGITNAVLNANKTAVTLTTLPQSEFTYRVAITNVSDVAGNQIDYPEFYINPLLPSFAGTPSTGARVDTDGDGLSDSEEQFGWAVRVTLADGNVTCRDVTSDPTVVDSDGDGLDDAEEQSRITNPRDDDSDADSLSDYDEANVYWSNYLAQDTDGDTLLDRDEVKIFKTSPALADSDGDSYSDFEEIFERSSHPLVADLPQAALELVGESVIKLDVKYTDGATFTTSVEDSFANENAFTTQKTETTVQKMTGLKDFSLNPVGLFSGLKTLFSGGGASDLNKMFQETTSTTTETTSDTYRNAHADYVSASQNRIEEVSSGFIKMGMQVRNTGDIAFTLQNLSVTVLQRDPFSRETTRVLATLKPGVPSLTLGPGGETGALVVEETAAPATLIKDILANPSGLMFEVATFDLVDDEGRNFAFLSEVTHSRTALVTIDHGDGRIIRNRVATDIKRNIDGTSAGVTMAEVMQNILGIDYETQVGDSLLDSGDTSTEEVLIRVEDTITDLNEKKFWIVIGSRDTHVAAGQDFDDITLKGGDSIILAYVTDKDGDGLIARHEFLFGTKDTDPDTDGDGLTDYEEVKLGWLVTTDSTQRVYSDPRIADSDRDGLLDTEECGVDTSGNVQRDADGNLICPVATDPRSFDTDGDGLCDGPGRLDNFDPSSPYYICRLGAPQDPNPLEPALFWPPSLLAVSPVPNALGIDPAADITMVFDQKMDAASSFFVNGFLSGAVTGSMSFGLNPDGSINQRAFTLDPFNNFKLGEVVEVSITDQMRNIDYFGLTPSYVYRFRTSTVDTGTGGAMRSAPVYDAGGTNPAYMVKADMNGDGHLDLVVAHGFPDYHVAVLINNGAGEFTPAGNYPLTGSPTQIVVGDFNGDGNPDVAVATNLPAEVVMLFNDGNAVLTPAITSLEIDEITDNAQSLAAGDFDGDGDLDLAVALIDNYLVSPGVLGIEGVLVILSNTGDGSFDFSETRLGMNTALFRVTAGDLDGDGDMDLLTYEGWGTTSNTLWRNDGTGAFTQESALATPVNLGYMATGDVDGDGDLDLVGTANSDLSVLTNNGDGTFAAPVSLGVGSVPGMVALLDYDQDGDLDVGVAVSWQGAVLLNNDGTGGFTEAVRYQAGVEPRYIIAGDVNADGDVDMVLLSSNTPAAQVAVLHNLGGGNFYGLQRLSLGQQQYATASGDLDGDGDADLVVSGTNGIGVLLNDGSGNLAAPSYYSSGNLYGLSLADLDRDGDLDVFNGGGEVLLNTGSGSFTAAVDYYTGTSVGAASGDFDGDGDLDLVLSDYNTDSIVLLRNDGLGAFGIPELIPTGGIFWNVIADDYDGDGDLDLAFSYTSSSSIGSSAYVLMNDGTGSFSTPVEYAALTYSEDIKSADMDGDGDVDLVVVGTVGSGQPGKAVVMFNNGDGVFGGSASFTVGYFPQDLEIGDVDGDGDLDLAVVHQGGSGFTGSSDLRILLNNGRAHFSATPATVLSGPEELIMNDMDGDGDLDVAVAGRSGEVWVIPNELPQR